MANRYDARDLEEPLRRVRKRTLAAAAAALAVGLAGLWFDFRYQPGFCGDTPCFQRSGALIVAFGILLAFMTGAVIVKSIHWGDQKPIFSVNEEASRYYGRAAFCLLVGGTLIWGFGDLLVPLPD